MNIALIAHDAKKEELVNFVIAYSGVFGRHTVFATGATGAMIVEEAKLKVSRLKPGPLGGDQQIGALVAQNEIDAVIFLRDPLAALAHEPDVTALLRLCDVQCVPVASNIATAELLVKSLERGDFAWREVIHKYKVYKRSGTEG
ncbi:methylglyoxal synthase [Paenibacillus contaminans]|uniref:Methylglyoxal synthase n=1 Tax=Paenibacillus contaminans TaxID=450362 RepID=A0A329M5A6_9BACL|nr:methylglyoxal synthase [Paenibacillus contaminans]RAV15355.1 methylglyoxal synthase [Paenibacillus contaminans]